MMERFLAPASIIASIVLSVLPSLRADEDLPTGVARILEDNAEFLLPQLVNNTGDPGEGHVENKVVFSGQSAIKIIPLQRFTNFIPGWAYHITEKPKEGEYRYLRFAWKSAGPAVGIMLQLHDDKDWNIRYTAGIDKYGWGTKIVAEKPPTEWSMVTVDLFKDFGAREIHGIALTALDGDAAYFDHIYFARSVDELDAIDATGLSAGEPIRLSDDDLQKHWQLLGSADASIAYHSLWTLVAAGDTAVPFLVKKLGGETEAVDEAQIKKWLKELDDDDYRTRERATVRLVAHLDIGRTLVDDELRRTTSAEVRSRLQSILKQPERAKNESELVEQKSRQILKLIKERGKK